MRTCADTYVSSPPAAHFHSSPLQHPLQHSLPPLAPIHRADAATVPSHRPQHDAALRLQTSQAHNTNTWGGASLDPGGASLDPQSPPQHQQQQQQHQQRMPHQQQQQQQQLMPHHHHQQQQLMPHQQLCHTQPVFQTAVEGWPADEDAGGGGYFGAVTLEPRAVSSPLPLPASTHPPAPEHTHTHMSAAAPPPAHPRAQVPAVPLFRPSAHEGGGWGGPQSCPQSRSGDGYFGAGGLEPPVPLFRYLRRYFSTYS
jgi:hypothetical protein